MPENIMMVIAEHPSSGREVVAAALNIMGSHCLWGRNWGCKTQFRNLHFELCYYQALDQAISR
jgi:predicted N-acyltransferase